MRPGCVMRILKVCGCDGFPLDIYREQCWGTSSGLCTEPSPLRAEQEKHGCLQNISPPAPAPTRLSYVMIRLSFPIRHHSIHDVPPPLFCGPLLPFIPPITKPPTVNWMLNWTQGQRCKASHPDIQVLVTLADIIQRLAAGNPRHSLQEANMVPCSGRQRFTVH